jgi:tRNA pseudouridine38-40 synthase
MPRFKLTLEYDGSHYSGWQKQPDVPSIQQSLEEAVEQFCGEFCEVVGAGRTDAGVHATGQAAHVDLPKDYDAYKVMQGLNYHMIASAPGISVLDAEAVPDEFHARFSATRRYYRYRITNRPARLAIDLGRAWHVSGEQLDASAMQEAASLILGHHDFSSFRDSKCQAKSPMKTLDSLDVTRVGEDVFITSDARSFLHHQVRNMVGSLVMVGKGKWQPDDMKKALEARDRTAAGPTAPPDGLFLTRVDY